MSKPKAQSVDDKHGLDTVAEMSKNEVQARSVYDKHAIEKGTQLAGGQHKMGTTAGALKNEAETQSVDVKHKINTAAGMSENTAQSSVATVKSKQDELATVPKQTVEKQVEVSDKSPDNIHVDTSNENAKTKNMDRAVKFSEHEDASASADVTTNDKSSSDSYNMPERYARFLHPPCALTQHSFEHLQDQVKTISEQRILKQLEDEVRSTMKQKTQVHGMSASDQMQSTMREQTSMLSKPASHRFNGRSGAASQTSLIPGPAASDKGLIPSHEISSPSIHSFTLHSPFWPLEKESSQIVKADRQSEFTNANINDRAEVYSRLEREFPRWRIHEWKNLRYRCGTVAGASEQKSTAFMVPKATLDSIDFDYELLKSGMTKLKKESKAAQEQVAKLEREKQATLQLLSNAGIDMRQLRAKHGPKM